MWPLQVRRLHSPARDPRRPPPFPLHGAAAAPDPTGFLLRRRRPRRGRPVPALQELRAFRQATRDDDDVRRRRPFLVVPAQEQDEAASAHLPRGRLQRPPPPGPRAGELLLAGVRRL